MKLTGNRSFEIYSGSMFLAQRYSMEEALATAREFATRWDDLRIKCYEGESYDPIMVDFEPAVPEVVQAEVVDDSHCPHEIRDGVQCHFCGWSPYTL